MNIQKAVEILNTNRHRSINTWRVHHADIIESSPNLSDAIFSVVGDEEEYNFETNPNMFTEFEAIAIARAYTEGPN